MDRDEKVVDSKTAGSEIVGGKRSALLSFASADDDEDEDGAEGDLKAKTNIAPKFPTLVNPLHPSSKVLKLQTHEDRETLKPPAASRADSGEGFDNIEVASPPIEQGKDSNKPGLERETQHARGVGLRTGAEKHGKRSKEEALGDREGKTEKSSGPDKLLKRSEKDTLTELEKFQKRLREMKEKKAGSVSWISDNQGLKFPSDSTTAYERFDGKD